MIPPFTAVFTGETLVVTAATRDARISLRRDDPGRFDAAVQAMAAIIQLCGGPDLLRRSAGQEAGAPASWEESGIQASFATPTQAGLDDYQQGFKDGLCHIQDLLDEEPDMAFVEWTGDMTLYDAGWYTAWCQGFYANRARRDSEAEGFDERVMAAKLLRETQQAAAPERHGPPDAARSQATDARTGFILASDNDLASDNEAGGVGIATMASHMPPP